MKRSLLPWIFAWVCLSLVVGTLAAEETSKPQSKQEKLRTQFEGTLDLRFDQAYAGTTNTRQMLDLYLPRKSEGAKPRPLVVYIHGGGWSSGSRIEFADAAIVQVSSGYAAASIGYRLTQEAKWPAQIHDCKAAIRWLRAHAQELNIDPDHIGVVGGSAGGHLVAMLGTTNDNKTFEGTLGEHLGQSSRVHCVINFCGPIDLTLPLSDDPQIRAVTNGLLSGLIGGPRDENLAALKAASPLTYVSPQTVPIMTIHGTNDTIVGYQHAELLDAALKKAGGTSYLIKITGGGHGLPFGMDLYVRIQAFLNMYLRDTPGKISVEPIEAPQAKDKK